MLLEHKVIILQGYSSHNTTKLSGVHGRKNRLKHVERITEINKLRNVASYWLYCAEFEIFRLCLIALQLHVPVIHVIDVVQDAYETRHGNKQLRTLIFSHH